MSVNGKSVILNGLYHAAQVRFSSSSKAFRSDTKDLMGPAQAAVLGKGSILKVLQVHGETGGDVLANQVYAWCLVSDIISNHKDVSGEVSGEYWCLSVILDPCQMKPFVSVEYGM